MLHKRMQSNPQIVPGLTDVRKALMLTSGQGSEDQIMTPLFQNMDDEGDGLGDKSERKLEMCR